jgi:GNAT superfamily N-acetyltransferase
MRSCPPGWATDLAILEHTGSVVEEHADHLIVRTPANPGFHWGNFVLVTDDDTVDDADHWVGVFGEAFPEASWVSVGLPRMPGASEAWAALGLDLEVEDVLSTRTLPRRTPLAPGYTVRRLVGDDWEQDLARAVAENAATGEEDPESFLRFVRGRLAGRQDLSARGLGAWFGAFTANDVLVADLGIVRCGSTARYQDVTTDEAHRRQGLASHLLGVAAQWAADAGCDQWVIVTEATNPAGRVYRASGFAPDTSTVQAYRRPPR